MPPLAMLDLGPEPRITLPVARAGHPSQMLYAKHPCEVYDENGHKLALVPAEWHVRFEVWEAEPTIWRWRVVPPPLSPARSVRAFHERFHVPVLPRPRVPNRDRVLLRLRLLIEEFFETLDAAFALSEATQRELTILREDLTATIEDSAHALSVDLPSFVDGLTDLAYIIEGTELECGVDSERVFALVHMANMTKVPENLRADGKILKPAGFLPPDVTTELRAQGWRPEDREE